MAEGELCLPDDLLFPKPAGSWVAKDDARTRRNDEEKGITAFLDDTKDQISSENFVPLSPQWLYAKPSESKVGLTTAAGKGDSHPDGSQVKNEWRRNVIDLESSRHWREEERDTGLLGRRECKKESDRENEYRKSDRRFDNIPIRETSDSRAFSSSDRWHEVSSRNSGHDNRWDSKWSARWGPEDKGKDVCTEKKMDLDKEGPHNEKQSFIGSNRLLSESDSRDKWRPRHRQEAHTTGSAVYRVAPGFGLERGRVEVSNVGFAFGRGRSTFFEGSSYSRSSSVPIGAAPVNKTESLHGRSALSPDMFRYPRGKLLDIYRKQKTLSSVNVAPEGLDEVPLITIPSHTEPLAFVIPDTEEEALLEDIWKGKVIASQPCYSEGESMERVDDSKTGDGAFSVINGADPGIVTSMVVEEAPCKASTVPGGDPACLEKKTTHVDRVQERGHLDHMKLNIESEGINSASSFDISTKLPDDSSSLFDTFIPEIPRSYGQCQSNNDEVKALDQVTPEEWNLFYRDPQ